jgi:hypothetical protein
MLQQVGESPEKCVICEVGPPNHHGKWDFHGDLSSQNGDFTKKHGDL